MDVRLGLAANAASSIDAQSYLWHTDGCGSLLLDELLAAADRGVRVRLLIDGLKLEGGREAAAALSSHPRVEIRIFNPTYHRGGVWELLEVAEHLERLDHRMHNKVFLVDGLVSVFGGRNIGDEYFGLGDEQNMRDFDMLASGDVTTDLAASFDEFWNSPWAIPVVDLAQGEEAGGRALQEARLGVTALHAAEAGLASRRALGPTDWLGGLGRARAAMLPGQAHVLHDVADIAETGAAGVMARAFERALDGANGDVLLVSAYLVPDDHLLESIRRHTGAGHRVRVLTNSFRSTNQPLVHAFYSSSRRELLEAGVELFELRPDAWSAVHHRIPGSQATMLGLHAKAGVFGQDTVVVGSMNLDPRSMEVNTEIGVLVVSKDLADAARRALERELEDRNAWRVTLRDDGELCWTSCGAEHRSDPDMPSGEGLREWFVRLLPVRGEM